MPPQIRGFGAGPGVGGPFHQPGFPSHGQPQGGPMGGNQYLNANAQMNPFANGNSFGAAGLNGAAAGFADSGFGSQNARMGFAHGPGLQQPQHGGGQVQHNVLMEHPTMRTQPNKGRIREVWKHNLHEEMAVLRDMVDKYPYIAMVSLRTRGEQPIGCGYTDADILTSRATGYGISGRRIETDGRVSRQERLPLPMPADQCRHAQGHPDWPDPL